MSDKIRTILLLCVLGVTCCSLSSCGRSKGTYKVGQHTVVIINTSLFGRGDHIHGTIKGAHDQYEWFTYEDGNLKVRLENEVLTVNGKRYLVPHKDDSITVRNEHVEINGKPLKPER